MSGLDEVAGELYALDPSEFVAARDERVKAAKRDDDPDLAAAIGRLRKPSTAAWTVNLLVRAHGDEVEQLLALGAAMREAQSSLSGPELRELNRQRHRVLSALGDQARALARKAGHKVSAGVDEEVQATLAAALADPEAAEQLRAGRLTTALHHEGFGPDVLAGATAAPAPSRERRDSEERAQRDSEERAERERREARERERRRQEAAEALEQAETELDDARRRAEDARRAAEEAEQAATEAEHRRHEAEKAVRAARTVLRRLGG